MSPYASSRRHRLEQGLTDNWPKRVEAVGATLGPEYGAWAMFDEWLPLNEGLLRRMPEAATPTAGTPAA